MAKLKTRSTIADVARLASVHPGTVSRVLNNPASKLRISDETRKRVTDAAAKLHFYPDHAAQSLAMKTSRTLGVCVYSQDDMSDFMGQYQADIIRGIEAETYKQGYDILLIHLANPTEDIERCRTKLYQRRVDGFIMIDNSLRSDITRGLIETGGRIVAVDAYSPDLGTLCINIDNIEAARSATEFLINLGHKKIGFIGSLASSEGLEESLRRQGYLEALKDAGLYSNHDYVVNGQHCKKLIPREGSWCVADGQAGIKELLERDQEVTAVLCMNDQVAAGAMTTLVSEGVSVPNDISVMGFDDSIVARYTYPPMTSVSHQLTHMGQQAAQRLIGAIQDDVDLTKESAELISTDIEVRKSTCPPPADSQHMEESIQRKQRMLGL